MSDYNMMELMICVASRVLKNGATVAVGTGAPCAAAMVAQKIHAPDLGIFFEAGGIAPLLPQMPISVGDSSTFYKAVMAASMYEMMTTGARGMVDFAFLGGAQIDKFGNINSTIIGDYENPKVRFPGSGGANDFASMCWKTIIMTVHNTSRFVKKVDFVTTAGYLSGPGAREEAGLAPGSGPYKIVTNLAIMGFDPQTKVMAVESIHPGVTIDEIKDNTGFDLVIPEKISRTLAPSPQELHVLRVEVDPSGMVIGR
jgi:glutaconate CoA-transferase subunit B